MEPHLTALPPPREVDGTECSCNAAKPEHIGSRGAVHKDRSSPRIVAATVSGLPYSRGHGQHASPNGSTMVPTQVPHGTTDNLFFPSAISGLHPSPPAGDTRNTPQDPHPYTVSPRSTYSNDRAPHRSAWTTLILDCFTLTWFLLFNMLPRQIYLHFLFRLPQYYFHRVALMFEEAKLTMPEMTETARVDSLTPHSYVQRGENQLLNHKFKQEWISFIDTLRKQWETLNIVSVLLLSAILTMLQIQSAATDPVTRYAALLSLICSLMSLLYGCMYIIHFEEVKKMHKAVGLAHEGQKGGTTPFLWNIWVLLAMPAIWLAWSIIFFVVCVMVFVWHTGTTANSSISPLLPHAALYPRIVISVVLSLGVLCFILILNTFAHWGYTMDQDWRWTVSLWQLEHERQHYTPPGAPSSAHSPHSMLSPPLVAPLPDSRATTINQVQH